MSGSSFNYDTSSNEEGVCDQEKFEESFSSLGSAPEFDHDESSRVCSNAIVNNNDWEEKFREKLAKSAIDSNVTRKNVKNC